MREIDHLEDLGMPGRVILKLDLKEAGWGWIGFIWLMIGTDDRPL